MNRDRYRGALLGVGLGDALGAPFEGRLDVDAEAVRAWGNGLAPLRWTDDTAMTIALADSLLDRDGFDGPHLAARFVAEYDAEPWRGYGAGPPVIFERLRAGAEWDRPAAELFGGEGSHGNGAAMRVAPVALFAHRDRDRLVTLARETARVTHAHELGMQGAALQALAVAHLLSAERLAVDTLVETLRPVAPATEYRRRLDAVAGVRPGASPAELVPLTGTSVLAVESVPAALAAFLAAPDSFPDAVITAAAMGGDSDTIAAMTGALAGAFLGAGALPAGWVDRLEAADRLQSLADVLFDRTAPG